MDVPREQIQQCFLLPWVLQLEQRSLRRLGWLVSLLPTCWLLFMMLNVNIWLGYSWWRGNLVRFQVCDCWWWTRHNPLVWPPLVCRSSVVIEWFENKALARASMWLSKPIETISKDRRQNRVYRFTNETKSVLSADLLSSKQAEGKSINKGERKQLLQFRRGDRKRSPQNNYNW